MPYILKDPPGNEYTLDGGPIWIGNHPTDDIILNDYSASSRQVEIRPDKQGLYLITNFGTYGIFINDFELSHGEALLQRSSERLSQALPS